MTTFTTEDRIAAMKMMESKAPMHWPLDHPISCSCEMCAIKILEMEERSKADRRAQVVDNHANRG